MSNPYPNATAVVAAPAPPSPAAMGGCPPGRDCAWEEMPSADETAAIVAEAVASQPAGGGSDVFHAVLDGVGMLPVIGTGADLLNAAVYAAQGDWTNAGLSAASAIPLAGDALGAAKIALKYGDDAINVATTVVSHADEAAAAVTTALKGGDDLAAGAIAYGDDVGDAAAAGTGVSGVALDTNVLIRGLDKGELETVDLALAGRQPTISPTAVGEYLTRGSQERLDQFLSSRGGRIGTPGTPEGAASLQAQAASMGRGLGLNDALIADSAIKEGLPLMTGDQQLLRVLNAIGHPVEGF